ncbi:DUF3592 domain-containing protein [Phycisphaeraceae bacterium D3-23]
MALSRTKSRRDTKQQALSDRATGKRSGGCALVLFGLVFFLAGLGTLVWMAVIPLSKVAAARSWQPVPCAVVSSQVTTHSDSDGTTYGIELVYEYEFGGQTYTSDRRSFGIHGSSSGYKGKKKFVDAHPPGHAMTCYVDPSDPGEATLERGVGLSFLWALFPLPFLLAGFFIMRAGVKSMRGGGKGADWRPDALREGEHGVLPVAGEHEAGPVVLRPRGQRLGGAVGLLVFGLIWNGVVAFPVTQVVGGWRSGDPDLCLSLFMLPFVAVGIGVMLMWVRQVMLVFAPVIEVELSRSALAVGETAELRWRVQGRLWRLTAMTIVLVGEEKATYRRGTDTVTDTHAFFEQTVAGADGSGQTFQTLPAVPERGSTTVTIPADTMHSFDAPNNKIVWSIKVSGEVHRWPDPKDTYELTILPRPTDTEA